MGILDIIKSIVDSAEVASAVKINRLKVDGYAGKETIKLLQGYFGCEKSGVLTGQKESLIKKYAPNVTAVKYNETPSLVVMKLQAWVGFDPEYINGVWDGNLSYALQYHLTLFGFSTGTCDGVFGKKSVKALQKFLNAQIPPQPVPSGIGDKVMEACKAQADWMHEAKYGKYSPVTLAHSREWGTCTTFEGCVYQRLGLLPSGRYVWHNGRGYGNGKVTGLNKKTMVCAYMNNQPIKKLKHIIQKGDCLLLDDNKSGERGNGGHVMFATGEWDGDNPYVWDAEPNMKCCRSGKPRKYSGNRKVLAIVRPKV